MANGSMMCDGMVLVRLARHAFLLLKTETLTSRSSDGRKAFLSNRDEADCVIWERRFPENLGKMLASCSTNCDFRH